MVSDFTSLTLTLKLLQNLLVLSFNALKHLSIEFLSPNAISSHFYPYLSIAYGINHSYQQPVLQVYSCMRSERIILTNNIALIDDPW